MPFRDEWVNNDCIRKINERDHLRGLLRYTDDEETIEKFKTARNTARQLINKARSSFIEEGPKEDQYTPKKYWKRFKKLMPGKKDLANSHINLEILDSNGEKFKSEDEMASFINEFFVNVGPTLASKIHMKNDSYL